MAKNTFNLIFIILASVIFRCYSEYPFISHEMSVCKECVILYDEIMEMTSNKLCRINEECKYIGIGSKACGGYWEYLVFSKTNVVESKLRYKVDSHIKAVEDYNRRSRLMSDCSVPNLPLPSCENNICIDAYPNLIIEQYNLLYELHKIEKNGLCENNLDCKVVGLKYGHCIGIYKYLAYSTLDNDEQIILNKVERLNQIDDLFAENGISQYQCREKKIDDLSCLDKVCKVSQSNKIP